MNNNMTAYLYIILHKPVGEQLRLSFTAKKHKEIPGVDLYETLTELN